MLKPIKSFFLFFMPMLISGFAGIFVGLAGFIRDRLIALNFGVGLESDIFFLSLAFPVFVSSVFASLSLSGFMPTYLRSRNKTTAASMLTVHFFLGVFIFIAGILVLPLVPKIYQESAHAFLVIIPLTVISALFIAIIHSHRAYLFANTLPVLPSLASIIAIYFFADHGIIVAVLGIVAGYVLIFLIAMGKAMSFEGPIMPSFIIRRTIDLDIIFKQYGVLIIGVAAMGANFMIDQIMAAQHGTGQASAFVYGSRLTNFIIALVTAAISNIILTEFSHMEAGSHRTQLKETSKFYERIFMAGAAFIAVIILVFSTPFINILFGGPQLTSDEIKYISLIQSMYVLQLPFFVGGLVYVHRLGAAKKNHITTRIALSNFVLNIVLNFIFGHYWGAAGIALSTSIVYLNSYLQLKVHFRRADR